VAKLPFHVARHSDLEMTSASAEQGSYSSVSITKPFVVILVADGSSLTQSTGISVFNTLAENVVVSCPLMRVSLRMRYNGVLVGTKF
jgi:hypothetical protein